MEKQENEQKGQEQKPNLVEQAKKAKEELEKIRDEVKAEREELERLKAEDVLGGQSDAGMSSQHKEKKTKEELVKERVNAQLEGTGLKI